jgi:di/tricarboxylate transporter
MTTVDTTTSHEPSVEKPASPFLTLAGQILCVLVPIVIWFAPLNLEPQTQHCFAIVSFMVLAWITQVIDFALAGFIGCFLFWALGIVRFPVAFSGFANDTAWFLFGALLIGVIATRSGIARRIAYAIMLRVGITYPRILLG